MTYQREGAILPLPSPRRAVRLLPVLVALLGTAIFHRYSLLTGLDRVQADTADSRFVAFLLEHWNNALHGRVDWRSPPIFWPVQDVLAYSESVVGMGVVHTALRLGLGVFEAMNAQLVLLTLASFAAAYALFARGARLSVGGATLGAAFFAFSWPRFAQLVHIQLQFTPLLPLMLLLALECVRDGRVLSRGAFAWRGLAFAALLVLLMATTLYFAIFFAIAAAIALALCLLVRSGRAHLAAILRHHAAAIAGTIVLTGLLAAPVVSLYLPVMRESGGRSWPEVLVFLPRPSNFLWMGRENLAWGWLFARWPEATIEARWAELRIGVGLVASGVWIATAGWAAWSLALRRSRLTRHDIALRLVIVTGLLLHLLMTRLPHDISPWWLVWKLFPGAGGLRAVARLELLVTLAMGLAFGCALDWVRRQRPRGTVGAALLIGLAAIEQVGRVEGYSAHRAEALSRMVAEAISRSVTPPCTAAYVVGTPDLIAHPAPVEEAQFDTAAYLAANPDVAAAWKESAWSHYQKFGRAENRPLDAVTGQARFLLLTLGYTNTIPLAAALAGIPVVNGLSGWQPPGWDLNDVLAPDAGARLSSWLALRHAAPGSVCLVPVKLTLEMVPFLPQGLLP